MITIGSYATKSYLYCWRSVCRHIAAAAAHHKEALFILATDTSDEGKEALNIAKEELPDGWKVVLLAIPVEESSVKYKEASQLLIARLQGAVFSLARKTRAELFWSVESDVLVAAESLKVAEWVLQMPQADGSPYYDVAAVTYPNGLFLGGFGTPMNQIAEDFLPEERKVPPRLLNAFRACKEKLASLDPRNPDLADKIKKEMDRLPRLSKKIRNYPPNGNIWEVTAKHGWRRRGWMEFAYPSIGRGSIVPSDWCGLGCTLMNRKALNLATFEGYAGQGTQDLYLCWNRWYPAGVKIACVPHVACDHVKPDLNNSDESKRKSLIHYRAYHEVDGEYRGHLRVKQQPWVEC